MTKEVMNMNAIYMSIKNSVVERFKVREMWYYHV